MIRLFLALAGLDLSPARSLLSIYPFEFHSNDLRCQRLSCFPIPTSSHIAQQCCYLNLVLCGRSARIMRYCFKYGSGCTSCENKSIKTFSLLNMTTWLYKIFSLNNWKGWLTILPMKFWSAESKHGCNWCWPQENRRNMNSCSDEYATMILLPSRSMSISTINYIWQWNNRKKELTLPWFLFLCSSICCHATTVNWKVQGIGKEQWVFLVDI